MLSNFRTYCMNEYNTNINSNNKTNINDACQIFIEEYALGDQIKLLRNTLDYRAQISTSVFKKCKETPELCSTLWTWIYSNENTFKSYIGYADTILTNYCRQNKNDPKCSCINPPKNLSKIEKLFRGSYYCWFSDCHSTSIYKTSYIREQQQSCDREICTISIGEINSPTAAVNIVNKCSVISEVDNLAKTSIEYKLADYVTDDLQGIVKTGSAPLYLNNYMFIIPTVYILVVALFGIRSHAKHQIH